MCSSISRSPSVVEGNLRVALAAGIDCVVGTTGLANDKLEELSALAPEGTCLFYAPNFTTGAVLMMQFAKAAAPFFPEAEVLEFHHCNKKMPPPEPPCARRRSSPRPATAVKARRLQGNRDRRLRGSPWRVGGRRARALGTLHGLCGKPGSGVRLHGQTLTIRHDSWDRASYMPGVLLGIRRPVGDRQGLIVGLENFME